MLLFFHRMCLITFLVVEGTKPPESHEPVIIAGGGLAGLSAALEALEHGSSVIIIESEKNTGGNSAKASSGINAHSTAAQEKLGIIDSATKFFYDTKQAGDGENDEKLVHVLVENSPNAIRFLGKVGVNLDDVNLCGGHSVARTHWVPSPAEGRPIPVGFEIMRKLREAISKWNEKKPDSVRILTETRVKGLYTWNDLIIGVVAQLKNGTKVEINGKAVILATGGFSADVEPNGLLEEFSPHLAAFPTTNGHFARGDGIKMARALDCPLVGMNHVQVHPTAFVDPADPAAKTKFLAAEALRGKGAILIDASGRRFANELGRRDHLSKMILTKGSIFDEFQGGSGNRPSAVMLMSEEMVKQFGHPAFNFYYKVKKFFTRYENLQKLADALRITRDILASTLDTYNADAMKKYDEFGKTIFPNGFEDNKPIYAALVTPAVHYTMGGIKIDKHARVETHYSGLFAAGEVSGGVHGSNRLAGNSLLECVVFGRIAGEMASRVGREKEFHTEL